MPQFTDVTGLTLSFDGPPQRVVSLVPSVTETLFEIGAASRIVGRTRYCVAPDPQVRAIERIGGTKDPDVGRIIALTPDLVIANREENRKQDIEKLRAAGVPVFVDEPSTVLQGLAMVSLLGRILDCEERADAIVRRGAQQLSSIAQRLRELEEQNAHKVKPRARWRPRVLAFIWRDPWMVAGAHTYISDMLKTLGATLSIEDPTLPSPLRERVATERYFTVEPADVAALAPDILLFPDEPYTFTEGDMTLWRDLALTVPAAREGRLRLCSGQDLAWFGSRTPDALARLQPIVSW